MFRKIFSNTYEGCQWIRLHLPSCRSRLESQAHHLHFYSQICAKFDMWKRTKINIKYSGLANLKKLTYVTFSLIRERERRKIELFLFLDKIKCGSVGRAIAFYTRDPQFESSHWQTLYYIFTLNCFEKTKIKEKVSGIDPHF